MQTAQKVIKVKVGLMELAKQLGNVSQACKVMATVGTVSIGSKSSMTRVGKRRCKSEVDARRT